MNILVFNLYVSCNNRITLKYKFSKLYLQSSNKKKELMEEAVIKQRKYKNNKTAQVQNYIVKVIIITIQ